MNKSRRWYFVEIFISLNILFQFQPYDCIISLHSFSFDPGHAQTHTNIYENSKYFPIATTKQQWEKKTLWHIFRMLCHNSQWVNLFGTHVIIVDKCYISQTVFICFWFFFSVYESYLFKRFKWKAEIKSHKLLFLSDFCWWACAWSFRYAHIMLARDPLVFW